MLPDYINIRRGYAKSNEESTGKTEDSEQVKFYIEIRLKIIKFSLFKIKIIRLNNERFTIPELLFHPSDIGINEMGIPEAIINSIDSCSSGKFL